MKDKERRQLQRIYNILDIPKFASGANSITIGGVASYASDCAYVLPKVRTVLHSMGTGESWDGETEEILGELESWIEKRKAEDWGA